MQASEAELRNAIRYNCSADWLGLLGSWPWDLLLGGRVEEAPVFSSLHDDPLSRA